ncbi:MAG: efflux RND transporter permease subunit [Elusimicrobia bacterium]|nr:efflux RND transporter permease subunit [Elusimicrobiota bacterium]
MDFIRFCVQRKVTVTMLLVAVLLFGVISWFRLDREFMPELQFPQLVVLTSYPNASSQEVENLVTKAVEEAVGTVKNVERIHSSSREGISVVTVEFAWGTTMDLASLNLREKVDLAKAKLPRDAGEPRIEKFNPFALPVISLSLSGPMEDYELLALARRPVGELLEKARGVAAVSITGGREREIHIDLDQGALTARGLPISDVAQAVSKANITYPAGNVKDKTFEYVVRVLGTFDTVESLGRVAVAVDRAKLSSGLSLDEARRKKQQGPSRKEAPVPIPLASLGRVVDTFAEPSSYSRYDGQSNISISILKQAEGNVVRVADEVKKRLPDIRDKLPTGVKLEVVYDQSIFVKDGIYGMVRDGLIGGVLAFVILLLFLGNLRDAAVVTTAVPISLLGTLSLLEMKGLSLNTITLAGLAIGIGNLTDGAIVVQENIARHRAMGKSPVEAAIIGAKEVFGAVTASNLTACAVFFPLLAVTGIVGQVFSGLSWSVIFSQLVSEVVAFTLIPMMSALLGGRGESRPMPFFLKLGTRAKPWVDKYNRALAYSLDHPGRVIRWAFLGLAASLALLAFLPRALFPKVEGSQLLLRLDMPMGTPLAATDRTCRLVEKILQAEPDVEHISATAGSLPQEGLQPLGNHQAQIVVDLKERRQHRAAKMVEILQNKCRVPDFFPEDMDVPLVKSMLTQGRRVDKEVLKPLGRKAKRLEILSDAAIRTAFNARLNDSAFASRINPSRGALEPKMQKLLDRALENSDEGPLKGHEVRALNRELLEASYPQGLRGSRAFADLTRPGVRLYFFEQGGTFSSLKGQGADVMVEVKGHDLRQIESISTRLADQLKGVSGLTNVRTSLAEPAPELQLEIKRDALANVSLSVSDLAEAALTALKGKVVSKFREGGKEIDIRLRLKPEDRENIEAVHNLYVHTPLDLDVPLGAVAEVRKGMGPSEILRYDQQRTIIVSADLEGRSINSAAQDIKKIMGSFQSEKDVSLTLTGESARMAESFSSLLIVLVLSIMAIFMIMASQFESLWQPFLILFSIPLALIGMGPALLVMGHGLTAMAGMGVILLAGIAVNNGIVLIDFVNQAQEEGISLKQALKEGCHTRLRPILMTALCTILGMMPLALGIGEGADMQSPMAVVVVSGLFMSTALTLVVLPAFFVIVYEKVFSETGRQAWMTAGREKIRFLKSLVLKKLSIEGGSTEGKGA